MERQTRGHVITETNCICSRTCSFNWILFMFIYCFFVFIIIPKRSFFIPHQQQIHLFFSNTVRVIIALKRSKPIYKTNCSDGHRPLFIRVCTRTDHLKYSIIPWMFTTCYFYSFKPHKLNHFPRATGSWHPQVLLGGVSLCEILISRL